MGEQQRSKPRSWVGSWARSEKFWRDLTSQTLAGFIVLLVGAFFAAVAGLIDWSIVGIVVLGIIVLIGTALLALAVGVCIRPLRARAHWSVRLLLELATDAVVCLPILGYAWLLSLFIRSH